MRDLLADLSARFLTVRYLSALTLVGCLLVASQVLVQRTLHRQAGDAAVINLAGRQRMLCEELTKAALAWRLAGDDQGRASRRAEVARVLVAWQAANQRLTSAEATPGLGTGNSPAVAAALRQLAPDFSIMVAAASALPSDALALDRLLQHEPSFLQHMEEVVRLYESEARDRVARLMRLELGLCLLMIAVLVAEALMVFRPAVRRLRQAVADRIRLQEQELVHSELSVAAETARSIGMDLHDGVCQTLTAMSMQAQALEKALSSHEEQPQAGALVTWSGQALDQVRAAAHRLCPIDIDQAGVAAALEDLAEATRVATGVDCRAVCERLAPAGGEDLYHIAQEAVANALRHGHAHSISISLRCEGPAGLLEITDDGMQQPATPGLSGLGLRSMRHRARRLGGALVAGPRVEGGWRVTCSFPLAGGSAVSRPAAV